MKKCVSICVIPVLVFFLITLTGCSKQILKCNHTIKIYAYAGHEIAQGQFHVTYSKWGKQITVDKDLIPLDEFMPNNVDQAVARINNVGYPLTIEGAYYAVDPYTTLYPTPDSKGNSCPIDPLVYNINFEPNQEGWWVKGDTLFFSDHSDVISATSSAELKFPSLTAALESEVYPRQLGNTWVQSSTLPEYATGTFRIERGSAQASKLYEILHKIPGEVTYIETADGAIVGSIVQYLEN